MPADRLYCTIGVHPTRCKEIEDSSQGPEAYWDALRVLLKAHAADDKVVAVGECGLDYDRCTFPCLLLTTSPRNTEAPILLFSGGDRGVLNTCGFGLLKH